MPPRATRTIFGIEDQEVRFGLLLVVTQGSPVWPLPMTMMTSWYYTIRSSDKLQ